VSSPEPAVPEAADPVVPGVADPTVPEAHEQAAPGRRFPRSAGLSAGALALGVVVVLLSSSPVWLRVTLKVGAGHIKLTGANAAGAAVPLALVAAAALIAIALVRNWVRRVLAVLAAAAGVGVLVAAVRVLANPDSVARGNSKVSGAGEVASVHVAVAPYLGVLGSLVIIIGAVAIALTCGRWPAPGRRYERDTAPTGTPTDAPAGRPTDDWDALERGEDPTTTG
jgi:uncharacterized membrane protein (TIGR02234 family)